MVKAKRQRSGASYTYSTVITVCVKRLRLSSTLVKVGTARRYK